MQLIYFCLYLCSCKTCGQRSNDCPGHCGHIELVNLAYNPMLFDKLYNIIQHTCFYCLRFRMDEEVVSACSIIFCVSYIFFLCLLFNVCLISPLDFIQGQFMHFTIKNDCKGWYYWGKKTGWRTYTRYVHQYRRRRKFRFSGRSILVFSSIYWGEFGPEKIFQAEAYQMQALRS